jgi:hypothetical protein
MLSTEGARLKTGERTVAMTAAKSLIGGAAAFGFVLVNTLAFSQPGGRQKGMMRMPHYDKATEVTLQGTVEKVEQAAPKNCPNCETGVHLWLDSDGTSYEVHLGPTSFLKEKEWTIEKGDALELTGSKVSVDDQSFILAREVKKADKSLVLRDANGMPAWSRRKPS